MRLITVVVCLSFLTACGGSSGGSSTTVSPTPISYSGSTLKVFAAEAGGAGVGRIIASNGKEMVMIAPNIVAEIAAANSVDLGGGAVDISTYPIAQVKHGYNVRTGVYSGFNVIATEKIGTNQASIVYFYNSTSDAIATGVTRPISMPSGTVSYNGIYVVGNRGSTWSESGAASINVDFNNNTFSLGAVSTDTTLSGTGAIDNANGRISSNNLSFTDAVMGNYTASTAGNIGSTNGENITGVWYTNDTAPDFAGAYAVHR